MRPPVLNPLFAPITTLPGIGSKVDRLYRRLLGRDETPRIIDLVFHLPTGTIDRRAPYLIYASDDTGDIVLTYFNARRDYLEKLLPIGGRRIVSGTTALYDGMLQMVHPDRVVDENELAKLPLIEPQYALTEGL